MRQRAARRLVARLVLASLVLAGSRCALALDPALDVDQYAHTAWRIREGFARGWIHALAQTQDGYLWLGTEYGLFRFDGVRVSEWQPPPGQALPNPVVYNLLVSRSGRLWIAVAGGLASWYDGKLTTYPAFAGWNVFGLREDREGTVWITTRESANRALVCAIRDDQPHCDGGGGRLNDWLGALYVDSAGHLWVTARDGVWRWSPGTPQFFKLAGTYDSTQSMSEDDDGALLIATRQGLMRIKDGKVSPHPTVVWPGDKRSIRMLRDRDGALWVGTAETGIWHLHGDRTDRFSRSDGLTNDYVGRILEDREGNIWIATRDGLDRFRALAIPTIGTKQGLSGNSSGSVLMARDGSIWIGTSVGLDRWRGGEITHFRGSEPVSTQAVPAAESRTERVVRVPGLPDQGSTLFEDRRGRIWVAAYSAVGYFEAERWTPVDAVPDGYVDGIAEDDSENTWLAHRTQGLLRLSRDGRLSRWNWADFGRVDFGSRIVFDPRAGGVWIGFLKGGVAHVVDGRVDAKYSTADGLGKGRVYFLRADPDGTLWVGSEGGLTRIRDRRIATLDRDAGLPCDSVDWTMDDAAGSTWIKTGCGLVRVPRKELDDWLSDAERGVLARTLRLAVFSDSDGVRSEMMVSSYSPHAGRAPDGRIWYATSDGLGIIDPRHLVRNELPPPVHIERVVANRVVQNLRPGSLELPALIRDLQIDYTALSLVAPEKMQFRYRLHGRDRDWQDAGTRREAYYSDLAPGDYRFQVIASNNDGVWNERGATLAFSIAPTFYQTRWFGGACAAGVLLVLGLLYALRVRQIEKRAQLRLDERVAERERIARDLHDTFLQSVQGLILRFHATMTRLPEEAPSKQLLEQALERADAVVIEGRNRVYGLRDRSAAAELPQALAEVAEEFSHDAGTEFRLTVQGSPRELQPLAREEAFRIGAEALINAFRHARARRIDLGIEYSRRQLCVRVTDDGRGFDVNALEVTTGERHFGLQGLQERARKIRAQLQVSSRVGSGSAVELRIPGSMAYTAAGSRRFFRR